MRDLLSSGLVIALSYGVYCVAATSQVTAQEEFRALEKIEEVAEYLQDRLSDDVYDLEGVAESVGADPHDVARYLGQNFTYRPYWGALKGGAGVLLDRAGNALDQSLLAAQLLSFHGVEVRIGSATLGDADAARVLALAETPAADVPTTLTLDAEMLSVFLNEGGLTRDAIELSVSELNGATETRTSDLATKAPELADQIATGLRSMADFLVAPPRDAEALAISAEYFWAEYQDTQGEWQVLEPLPVNLASNLRAGAEYFGANDIPKALVHEVVISVALRLDDGSQTELATAVVPSTLGLYAPLEMLNRPVIPAEPATLTEALGITSELPAKLRFSMSINGFDIADVEYQYDGTLLGPADMEGSTSTGLESLTRALDNLGAPQEEGAASIVGLALTYTVNNSQGGGEARHSQTFERLVIPHHLHAGPAFGEAGFRSPWIARMWVIPFAVEPAYFDYRVLESDLARVRSTIASLDGRAIPNQDAPHAMISHSSLGHRTAMLAREMDRTLRDGDAPFADRMAVIVEETGLFAGDEFPTATTSIDLMQIWGGTLPATSTVNGLSWTLAEALALEHAGTTPAISFGQTLARLQSAAGLTVSAVVTREQAMRYQANLAEALISDIEDGRQVVVFSHYGEGVYLSREPNTGLIVGRLAGGRGQATTSKTIVEGQTPAKIEAAREIALALRFLSVIAETGVCLATSPGPQHLEAMMRHNFRCMSLAVANIIALSGPTAAASVLIAKFAECLYHTPNQPARCGVSAVQAGIGLVSGLQSSSTEIIVGALFSSGVKAATLTYDFVTAPTLD